MAAITRDVFVENPLGIDEYLQHDPTLRAVLKHRAENQLKWAVANAPVGDPAKDIHSGDYRDSLEVVEHHSPTRMSFRLQTADFKRYWIEYGSVHMTKHRILGKSLDHATD